MTDAWLMEADCIHGVVWYECEECSWPDEFRDESLENRYELPEMDDQPNITKYNKQLGF